MAHGEQFLSIEDVARRLGVSREMVYRLAIWGILPYVYIFGRKRFRTQDIETYLRRTRGPDFAVT